MKSPADILRKLLINLEQAEETGSWTVFVSFLPDTPEAPDEALCIYDTAGKLDGRIMATGEQVEHPGIQIRVRGKSYPDTWEKVNDIVKALDAVRKVPVAFNETEIYTVHNVSRSGAVIPLGMDESGNKRLFHFTANMVLTVSVQDS